MNSLLFTTLFLIQAPVPASRPPDVKPLESPFKTLEQETARSLILLESHSNVGFRQATAVIVDVEKHLAVTAWHTVSKADTIQVLFAGKEIDANVFESQQLFLKNQGTPATVVFHEPANDLALIFLKEMPAKCKAVSLAKKLPEPDCKLYLDGHPFEKSLLWQRVEGKAVKTVPANWDWADDLHLRTTVLEIDAAALGRGFSGGAVRNEAGEWVGLVIAGQKDKVYAVEGTVLKGFLERAKAARK